MRHIDSKIFPFLLLLLLTPCLFSALSRWLLLLWVYSHCAAETVPPPTTYAPPAPTRTSSTTDSGQCCEASAAHYLGFTFMLLSTLSFTVLPLLLLLLLPPPLADCSRTSVGYKDEAQAVPAPLSLPLFLSLSISLALCSVLFGCKGGDISVILMRKCEARVTFSLSLWDMRFSLTPPPTLSLPLSASLYVLLSALGFLLELPCRACRLTATVEIRLQNY